MSTAALTLSRRRNSLELAERRVCPGATAGNLARCAVLQGFCYAGSFSARVFLLYGLIGDLYGDKAGDLHLRRRKLALEVA